ncbi:MAG: hypothetical protein KZQ59_05860, partial [Candidatus Thiodiazotropha sp. (ex Lucinoma aequizonata)]|nr:hypothetical protein [Candidatus Thiodiazotropha sp. (ex Lucinoma aequizonata)]MCU7895548.1 hypothetical protein [Candidatus Thiodiazotropha sp. (ex Lucinoma aequizonata)]MCU7899063.1 hypothetical protein [Candidatus Thiodiazotropha sp. (ex Lucinoma aequizonata)]MCU7909350.1 hypothetical protein [Candidatus Thiodiazotropha sp. (ex Lucinoma aequizonata)]
MAVHSMEAKREMYRRRIYAVLFIKLKHILHSNIGNYSAALYLRLLNSHLIGFLALAKERVRLL